MGLFRRPTERDGQRRRSVASNKRASPFSSSECFAARFFFALSGWGDKINCANWKGKDAMNKKLGRYLVVDSKICHGQPTFRGTRILVKDVLEQVAQGIAWTSIEKQWRGAVTQAAIAEAVRLANKAFLDQVPESAAQTACP
jgi:uncharacterized protein (DUF433 family)